MAGARRALKSGGGAPRPWGAPPPAAADRPPYPDSSAAYGGGEVIAMTALHLSPLLSIVAGVAILVWPRLLNYIVAAFLIVSGLIGLGVVR